VAAGGFGCHHLAAGQPADRGFVRHAVVAEVLGAHRRKRIAIFIQRARCAHRAESFAGERARTGVMQTQVVDAVMHGELHAVADVAHLGSQEPRRGGLEASVGRG